MILESVNVVCFSYNLTNSHSPPILKMRRMAIPRNPPIAFEGDHIKMRHKGPGNRGIRDLLTPDCPTINRTPQPAYRRISSTTLQNFQKRIASFTVSNSTNAQHFSIQKSWTKNYLRFHIFLPCLCISDQDIE